MPVAQGINGTIIQSQQTLIQREAFNANNPDGQRASISSIFSSSPIHSTELLNAQGDDDRSGLFGTDLNPLEGENQVEIIRQAYANLLNSTNLNGFGFENTSTVNLNFTNDDVDFDVNNLGVVVPDSSTRDKPQIGSANLNVPDIESPFGVNSKEASATSNNNFGTSIPNPDTDTLGQFFNNLVNTEGNT